MPSQAIIPSSIRTIQTKFTPQIPKRWQYQFQFGIQTFTLKPFKSLASNARQTVAHPDTASTKVDRLTQNQGLTEALAGMVARLGVVTPSSLVNCDHSDFKGLMAFVGAVQTGKGRAVPVLVGTGYSPRLSALATAPKRTQALRQAYRRQEYHLYEQAARELVAFRERLGFWPRLVFDRGFGGLPLVRFLVEQEATFYVRLKADRYVELAGQRVRAGALRSNDSRVRLQGLELRLVRSPIPAEGEPWYILTSDFTSSAKRIVKIYYYRFEIEETFKDLKHVLDLEQAKLTRPLSLKVLLWFASLTFILAYLVTKAGAWLPRRHPKKQTSWFKQFFEALQRELGEQLGLVLTGGPAK